MPRSEAIDLGKARRDIAYGRTELEPTDELIHCGLLELQSIGLINQEELENYFDDPRHNIQTLIAKLHIPWQNFLELGMRNIKKSGMIEESEAEDEWAETIGEKEVNVVDLINEYLEHLQNIIASCRSANNRVIDIRIKAYQNLSHELLNLREKIKIAQEKKLASKEQEREFGQRLIARVVAMGGVQEMNYNKDILPLVDKIFNETIN
ncbi:MAG: hypothetical protein V1898_02025 [Patescibacteria group bacterium]